MPRRKGDRRRWLYASMLDSQQVGNLNNLAFRVWVHLILMADDEGRFIVDERAVRATFRASFVTPRADRLRAAVQQLADEGLIVVYDVSGVRHGCFPKWKDFQPIRPDIFEPSRLPPPPGVRNGTVTEPARNRHATATQPQRNRHGTVTSPFPYLKNPSSTTTMREHAPAPCERGAPRARESGEEETEPQTVDLGALLAKTGPPKRMPRALTAEERELCRKTEEDIRRRKQEAQSQ